MNTGTKLKLGLATALLIVSSACTFSTGGGYSQAWYDVYGNRCATGTPSPGCNFYWDGSKISSTEDPYYSSYANFHYAHWFYTDSYGYNQSYTGYGWQSSTGILYDSNGYALNNSDEQDGRDLIGDVSAQEQKMVQNVGKDFADKYALSETTGIQIAKTLNDWATLSKKQNRARTEQDVADFSQRLYGVSYEKTKSAIETAQKGDSSGLNNLNGEVAAHWGTNPETSKAILKSWYRKQLSDVGIH